MKTRNRNGRSGGKSSRGGSSNLALAFGGIAVVVACAIAYVFATQPAPAPARAKDERAAPVDSDRLAVESAVWDDEAAEAVEAEESEETTTAAVAVELTEPEPEPEPAELEAEPVEPVEPPADLAPLAPPSPPVVSEPVVEPREKEVKASAPKGWKLVWSDEFDKPGRPDPTKWGYEEGWVRNGELQYYTKDRPENSRVEGGHLVIEARKERFKNPGQGRAYAEYTAASVTTRYKASWTYARIEVRAKIPTGKGTWPAIWMLGNNIDQAGWPACGEIDILENVGYDPEGIHANVHTKGYSHMTGNGRGSRTTVPRPWEDFHTYAVEWTEEMMVFTVDGRTYFVVENDGTGVDSWPFDKPQYLILNFAVGGSWGAAQGFDESIWPQKYLIDYVRVYKGGSTVDFREADKVAKTAPGLAYKYYEGSWTLLPDFDSLKPVAKGYTPEFTLDARKKDDRFGFVYEGYIQIEKDGVYLFYTESDDGSALYIGDEAVVMNDGGHAMRESAGRIGLKRGKHRVRVVYFEGTRGQGLIVRYKGPGVPKQPIPANVLFRRN